MDHTTCFPLSTSCPRQTERLACLFIVEQVQGRSCIGCRPCTQQRVQAQSLVRCGRLPRFCHFPIDSHRSGVVRHKTQEQVTVRLSTELIGAERVAELLGHHPEHLRPLARPGMPVPGSGLLGVKAGSRAWLFGRTEVEKWKAKHPRRGVQP